MDVSYLELVSAESVLGLRSDETLPAAADALVDSGIITPSLAELASRPAESTWEVGHLLEESLHELGRSLPSRDEALLMVLRDRMRNIVSAPAYPQEELERFMDVFSIVHDELPDDSLLWPLYADADAVAMAGDPPYYRGARGERALRLIDSDVREHAQSWLDAHGLTSASS